MLVQRDRQKLPRNLASLRLVGFLHISIPVVESTKQITVPACDRSHHLRINFSNQLMLKLCEERFGN
ncbi:hypothetical protein [Coleofasciculus sp. FACHB-501]|uniref:hypothetical protein n=1 Tax=Cyanophyceae TaxID=3028117 RepID=UPI0019A7391B|nr:hypothetical protein [Coleofasciculus sp. FACHB-501]MBD1840904.1 hypothetical protein [Coleofasciculus sp. FACHB-501]